VSGFGSSHRFFPAKGDFKTPVASAKFKTPVASAKTAHKFEIRINCARPHERMETSLHRQLKALYAGEGRTDVSQETRLGCFRIDVVRGKELVEIQHGSLAAIRTKVSQLLNTHRVLVVKPLVVRKTLIQCEEKNGPEISRRLSPKRGSVLSLFDELIYFCRVFPHRRLTLETPLVEIEEWRYPGHGRRRRWRRNDFQVADQKLVRLCGIEQFHTSADLLKLLPRNLPRSFHTGHLAEGLGVQRWMAQRIAYCLRHMRAVQEVGKAGNARLYEIRRQRRKAA
jgi:hypothetical protein